MDDRLQMLLRARTVAPMNQAMIIRKMVEQAKAGCSLPADEALVSLAAVIDGLDMNSDTYEADVVTLIGVGSTVCTLSGLGDEQLGTRPP